MKWRGVVVLLIVAVIGSTVWLGIPKEPVAVRVSEPGASFSLPDLEGRLQNLPKGEVVLLNFWATWCPPCRKEIPSMLKLHEKFAANGLKIVAVSVDKDRQRISNFVQEQRMPFMVLHDAHTHVAQSYGVTGYPQSFLIDKQGKVRYHLLGAVDWMVPPLQKTIEGMLAEPAATVYGSSSGERENNG